MTKKSVIILSGQGRPAVAALNIYIERLNNVYNDLIIIEEKNITRKKAVEAIKKRYKKFGVWGVIDLLLLRIIRFFFFKERDITKNYSPKLTVDNMNDVQVEQLIQDIQPDLIITNACSILKKRLLSTINCPIINIHNGVNPRYRGTGNLWAFQENNPFIVGTTIHYIDEGVDTGERIAIQPIDFRTRGVRFEDIDSEAFMVGANMVVDFLLNKSQSIPPSFFRLSDRLYTYPGLSHYLTARKNYNRFLTSKVDIEQVWHKSFRDYAADSSKSKFQRMHWGDTASITPRDELVKTMYHHYKTPEMKVIDVGCGDGRYQTLLEANQYIGCDYAIELLKIDTAPNLIQCSANNLPFQNNTFDAAIAIGLFQHIEYAQYVADELQGVVKPNGLIIINTLRQFSWVELLLIGMLSIFNRNRLALAVAIFKRDYFGGKTIDGTLVARRYTLAEILDLFNSDKSLDLTIHQNGLLRTSFLAREITVALRNTKKVAP